MESLTEVAEKVLISRGIQGKIIFAMLGGSSAYNLALPSSDKDIFAVYSVNPESLWSLRTPSDNLIGKVKLGETETDISILEIGKFCSLLISGNPTIIEALYATHNSELSPMWENLKENREKFLSNELINQYVSFASGQLAQIKSKPENNKKKIYNATRLLMEARRLVNGEDPRVWLEGEDQQYLMEIRNEKYNLEELCKKCQSNIDDLRSAKPWPRLPKVDEGWVNHWLLEHRKARYINDQQN